MFLKKVINSVKYINTIPFPLTLKHYFDLGSSIDLASKEDWDIVRLSHPHFVVPESRKEWLKSLTLRKDGQDGLLEQRAIEVVALLKKHDITWVHSVGVGAGAFEYYLKKHMPELYLVASDYNPLGVERLQKVFTECDEVLVFDIFKDSWRVPPNGLVLMFRVDPHFTNEEWKQIVKRMRKEGVQHILFIPANYLTVRYIVKERFNALKGILHGRFPGWAGYIRTKETMKTYWDSYPSVKLITLGAKVSFFVSDRK